MNDFCNLHLHTDGSLLDGLIRIPDLVKYCQQHNLSTVAISDHGNMINVLQFYKATTIAGIKPLIGQEFYLVEDMKKKEKKTFFHQLLVAYNNEGYRNLLYLTSKANQDGFYMKPCIDFNLLKDRTSGIIATSCCLSGYLPKTLLWLKHLEEGKPFGEGFPIQFLDTDIVTKSLQPSQVLSKYTQLFKDNFYLEIMKINHPDQDYINDRLFELGQQYSIPIIITPDAHYINPEDKDLHELWLANRSGTTINAPTKEEFSLQADEDPPKGTKFRWSFGEGKAYLLNPTLVQQESLLDPRIIEPAKNTLLIAQKANINLKKVYSLPDFATETETAIDILTKKAKWGLVKRFGSIENVGREYRERLQYELDTIDKLNFTNYFLTVSDYVNWSKDNNIMVGPGRGSGVGSLVCWALRITEIDPLKYGLLFHRFINPGRKDSLPDIDLDWGPRDKQKVINYLIAKWGQDRVAPICLTVPLGAKAAIKDIAKVLDFPFSFSNEITSKFPDPGRGKTPTFEFANKDPNWVKYINSNADILKIVRLAERLEGQKKNTSVHAGGVIISGKPIYNRAPLVRQGGQEGQLIVGFNMKDCEETGLVKCDLLSVDAIETIDRTIKAIQVNSGQQIDINNLPLNDPKVFEKYNTGEVIGIFQFDGGNPKSPNSLAGLAKAIKIESLEDISTAIALYRPGPLDTGMDKEFLKLRKKRK